MSRLKLASPAAVVAISATGLVSCNVSSEELPKADVSNFIKFNKVTREFGPNGEELECAAANTSGLDCNWDKCNDKVNGTGQ